MLTLAHEITRGPLLRKREPPPQTRGLQGRQSEEQLAMRSAVRDAKRYEAARLRGLGLDVHAMKERMCIAKSTVYALLREYDAFEKEMVEDMNA
jgi:hypothetical protein